MGVVREFRLQPPAGGNSGGLGVGVSGSASTTRHSRARSVDVLSSKSDDPVDSLSKLKDFDLKKSVDARIERLSQSLAGPAGSSSKRLARRSRLLVNASQASAEPTSVGLPMAALASVSFPVTMTPQRSRGYSVPPISASTPGHGHCASFSRRTEAPHDIAKKLWQLSSTGVERKGNVLLRAGTGVSRVPNVHIDLKDVDWYRSRGYVHELLETLTASRDVYDMRPEREETIGENAIRSEVDSFAALINKARVPVPAVELRRSGEDDFYTRLDRSRGDLERLETLVGRTFHWSAIGGPVLTRTTAEPVATESAILNEIRTRRGSDDVVQFVVHHDAVGHGTPTASSAEQAIRWAQERKMRIEADIERERRRQPHYMTPVTLNSDNWKNVRSHSELRSSGDYALYERKFGNEVPTIVRSPPVHRRRITTSEVIDSEGVVAAKPYLRHYTRSCSDSAVGSVGSGAVAAAARARSGQDSAPDRRGTRTNQPTAVKIRNPPSEVRRHVREVLDKYRK